MEGTDQVAEDYVTILAVCFTGMKAYFEEKYNRHLFYKNLFLENILPEDVHVRAKYVEDSSSETTDGVPVKIPEGQNRLGLEFLNPGYGETGKI